MDYKQAAQGYTGYVNIADNISLADHSTMRLGGVAAHLTEVKSRSELQQAISWAQGKGIPMLVIGDGSNIVWRDEGFDGLVIVNSIPGYEEFSEDENNTYITIGAGENWDNVVARTVQAGLTGVEALSLIPGTAGATPVQNVGAYGQEISQTLTTVVAFDAKTNDFVTLRGEECNFSYRNSRFKSEDRGRFVIIGLTLHLRRGSLQPPFYGALQRYLDENKIHEYSPRAIREAVIAIRSSKLPDPSKVANNGSFFANPVVTNEVFSELQVHFPGIPSWPVGDSHSKLSAAWLIEQAGFKDFHDPETGMATWHLQPLVLVNEKAKSTTDLIAFRDKILGAVQSKFGITLTQEPELLP